MLPPPRGVCNPVVAGLPTALALIALLPQEAQQAAITIGAPTLSAASAPVYSRVTLEVPLQATFNNPFDPAEVALEAQITMPSGRTLVLPGYFAQDLDPSGAQQSPKWRVRFSPLEPGSYKIALAAKDRTGEAKSQEITFSATPALNEGFIRASKQDKRYLVFDSGRCFFPIGANLPAGLLGESIAKTVAKLKAVGVTLVRLPLSPPTSPFALETKAGGGVGRIDLANASSLELFMELADQHGIKVLLTLDSYHLLRDRDRQPFWEQATHNRNNGGPLDVPSAFWTDPTMGRMYRNKLRYLVARYAAYSNLLGWELWNKADLTRGYDPEAVRLWHEAVAADLARLDPYGHLTTSSTHNPLGNRIVDRLNDISLTQTHLRGESDPAAAAGLYQAKKVGFDKPHLITDIGQETPSDRDREQIVAHDTIWVSLVTGAAATAMPTLRPDLPEPAMKRLFLPAAKFARGLQMHVQAFRPATPTFEFQEPPSEPILRDLEFTDGPASWDADEYNLPRRVRLDPAGVKFGSPVAGILHGSKNPSLQNPVTFIADLPRATQLDIDLGEVSPEAAAMIELWLDGRKIAEKQLEPSKGEESAEAAGASLSFELPAGKRTLEVRNTGQGWVKVGYRFRDLLVRSSPPLTGWGMVGEDLVIAWIRHADRTHRRIVEQSRPVKDAPPSQATFEGLKAGTWRAEVWDTRLGVISNVGDLKVGQSGLVKVMLPAISSDIAVKLVRAQPGKR